MSLIFRRILSSSINGVVISILLLTIYFSIASALFFFPVKNYLGMYIFSTLFAAIYSFCGSMDIGWLPTLGKRITKIKLKETNTSRRKSVKIMFRILLWYIIPSLLLFIAKSPGKLFNHYDPYEAIYVEVFLILLAFCVLLPIPIAIIVTNGKQGLHDFLSGIIVLSPKSNDSQENLPLKKILVRTFIVVPIIAIFLTFGVIKLNIASNFHKITLNSIAGGSETERIKNSIDICDSTFPDTPKKLRSYDVVKVSEYVHRFIWWVDLTSDIPEQLRFNEKVGMKKFNRRDLLAYGFSMERTVAPIKLINTIREEERNLSADTKVLSVFLFCDARAYFSPEIRNMSMEYFIKNIISHQISKWPDAIRIKVFRIVKVGVVKIGYCEELYITSDGKYWRDKDHMILPVPFIAVINFTTVMDNAFITSRDLDPPSPNSSLSEGYFIVYGRKFSVWN